MSADLGEIILSELRDTRKEMNEEFTELRQRSTAIETNHQPFFATGGGKDQIEDDIEDLKKSKYYALGGAGVLAVCGNWFLHKLGI